MTSLSGEPTGSAERQTFWCHECDQSVSLAGDPVACPDCSGDFLELMDSPLFSSGDDDETLPDGAFLRRLIRHLSAGDSVPDPGDSLPASKAAVEAIPTVEISASLLNLDPFLLCAVCKDHFAPTGEAKQLPCNHLYHSDCILPWLARHNSCPVCRFRLPTEEPGDGEISDEIVLGEGDGDDWFDCASTLRHIARRRNLVLSPELLAGEVEGNGIVMSSSSASENSR